MQGSFDSRLDSVDMDAHGLIKVLKDNLRQYPQDTVLRELVQNADDAEATFFACIHVQPSQSKTVSPAVGAGKLIIVNDGPVSDEQRTKMFRLRAGWQIGNESKIGKFGLGLKSIFHWCDFAWKMQLIHETGWQAKFVDPVGAPNLPLDQVRSVEDDTLVLNQIQSLVKKHFGAVKQDLFVLVLALRDESTCKYLRGECNYQPISTIPTNFDKNIESEHLTLSRLLPCLSNLQKIVTIVGDKVQESSLEITKQYPDCVSRLKRLDTRMPMTFKSSGFINSILNGRTFDTTPFALLATEVKNEHLSRIYNSDEWPVEWISDETGDHQVKEKAVQTGGVILIGNGTDHVRLLHATYLPLRDVLLETNVDGKHGFDILIHGTFHVDSGRNSILKLSATYDTIKTHWNTALYKHVVSPQIIEAIDMFMPMMAKGISTNDEDRVWKLIRDYNSMSFEFFSESGITDRTELIYRSNEDGTDTYYVCSNEHKVYYLPNYIRACSDQFIDFEMCLNDSIFTSDYSNCLMTTTPVPLSNPLSLFGLKESIDAKILAKLQLQLEGDHFVIQDKYKDGSIIANVIRWHCKNGKFQEYEKVYDWTSSLCEVLVVREEFAPQIQMLEQDLSKRLQSNEFVTIISGNCNIDQLKVLAVSAKRLSPLLEAFESLEGQDKRIVGAVLFIELSIEGNVTDQNLLGNNYRYQDRHTSFRIPLRYKRGHVLFQGLRTVRGYFDNDRCSLDIANSNRLNLVRRLDADTEFEIIGLSQKALEKLGFIGNCNQAEFIRYITEVDRFSDNKGIASHCVRELLDCYHEANNRDLIDHCVLKVATWNSNLNWIAVERDLTSPTVTNLLVQLGHSTISENILPDIDSDLMGLLINHAITFPDNKCVRLLTTSNLKLAIDEATSDQLGQLTFDHPEQDKRYLLNVARLGPETLRKLPIVCSVFGKPVVPDQAKLGVIQLPENVLIPIVSSNDSKLLKEFDIDFVVPDGLLINDSDCVNDNQLFDIILRQSFADGVWSESQRIRLDNLYRHFASRGKFKVDLAAKSLRQHVIPNLLDGQSVYLVGDCPEPITTALMEVFHIRLLDDTADPVITDICNIDVDLSQLLIPQLSIQVIEEEIWIENSTEAWTDYWKQNSDFLPYKQRLPIHKWIRANKHPAKSLEFFAPLPIHKTWRDELCSPLTHKIPAAKVDFSWLRYVPKNHDFFVVPSLLNLEAYSETELFEYVTREMDNLGETIWKNITEFGSVLRSKELAPYLAKIPFIDVNGTYRTVDDILVPSAEHKTLDENIARILGKSTKAPDFIESFPVFTATRQDVTCHLQSVCEAIASDPEAYAIGNHQFTVDQIRVICDSVSKPKHATFRLLKAIVDSDSLSLSDRNKFVSDVLVATKGFSCVAAATLTFDLCHAGLTENPNIKNLIVALITSDIGNRTIDFCVPTSDQKWSSARNTLVHNINVLGDNVLDPEYGREIRANLGSSAISDISEYFEHDVWADFQSLKSATLAMLGLSTKSLEFAQSGLPTGVRTVDLISGFERDRLKKVSFYVRHMNQKTRMQLCNGHFVDIETSPDQLNSLVDHIDTTTDQVKVYLVLPTAHVDPNELRTLLLDLAPRIYDELGLNADECKRRIKELSDDGQTTIMETQQIALSRFQTTLQMIGQSLMPTELLELAEEITNQQIRLAKSQSNILGRRQRGKNVELDETELDLIERNIELQATVVDLLEKESTIHKQSVEAIRDATTRYSYDKLSFAFELIQNADDALEQLKDLNEFPDEDAEVIVDLSTGAFIIAHPGRRINYFQNKDRSIIKTKFKHDLVYMLTLNLTDKADVEVSSKDEQQYRPVTGKYGLGFKSVYHVTDDVKITSGELATEFRCGIWPKKLDSKSRSMLDSWREQRNLPKSYTVIRLGGVTQVPKDFVDALVLLPLSTRNIRSIEFTDSVGKTTKFSCKSTRLTDYVNLIETTSKRTFLQVLGTDNYTWQCFELVDGLPVRVKDMSNYWVTVPTRVTYKPGFVCNAAFPLNSARTDIEHNDFIYAPFCNEFAKVMVPAYVRLYKYLSSSLVKPELQIHNKVSAVERGQEIRNHLEDMLKGDGKLFAFLKLQGLSTTHQEQMIDGLSDHLTEQQVAAAKAEQATENQPEKPPLRKSEIEILLESLEIVDEKWHQKVDRQLYGDAMSGDWEYHIAHFDCETAASCQTWQRLILRSMLESIGFQSAISKSNIINKRYIERAINLTKSPNNQSYPIELANFLKKPFWDETDSEEFTSTFYFGELFSTAMLTSNLEDTVEHIRLTLQNFSINRLFFPRDAGFAHLLRGALGPKAISFMLREVLRCASRVDGTWLDSYSRPEQYACVIDSNLQKSLGLQSSTDHERSQELSRLITSHGFVPKEVGFDIQIRERLKGMKNSRNDNVYR